LERFGIIANKSTLLRIPIYLLTVNISILIAWYRYFRKERIVIWNPTVRL
jgi:hypothetical protein